MTSWASSPSIRVRLTLWHAGVLAAMICLFSVGVFVFVKMRLSRGLDEQLRADLAAVEQVYREDPGDLAELDRRMGIALFEVVDRGVVMHRTAGWPPPESRYRVTVMHDAVHRVSVARDEAPMRQTLWTLAAILAIGIPTAIGIAVAAGYVLAGRLLAPVGAMATTARKITEKSLHERLPVANPRDELGQLAGVFNETLTRLQDAFEQLRRFTADASHELRTPLSAMRSVGEVTLERAGSTAEYREAVGSMLEEVDRLTRLVENLLTLTRGESGRIPLVSGVVDICGLVTSVADSLQVLAEEKRQSLTVQTFAEVQARCDATVLRQGLVNVIDNAIKYTPSGGAIRVGVSRAASGEAAIEVADTGPGIPAADRQRIFDRFVRVGGDRSTDTGGVGLGLAIARWAVEANAGRIEVDGVEGQGAVFRILLPSVEREPVS